MPTGYTYAIQEGAEFKDFIMMCARQFGALVSMRDEPSDAEIPERFEPSDYHSKRIEEVKDRLLFVESMSEKDASEQAENEYRDKLRSIADSIKKANSIHEKYISVLSDVKKWNPPTSDHNGLKEFMIDQIEKSISFDCDTSYYEKENPELLTGQEWIFKEKKRLLKDLRYHIDENAKEIERTESRNKWLADLRESLK